jgi:hypothetical protein
MIIRNVTEQDLYWALAQVNGIHDNNIVFKKCEQIPGRTRQGDEKWSVILTVRSCYASGGRYYPKSRRHVSAACWHAHGRFFDCLPRDQGVIIVTSMGGNYNTQSRTKVAPGERWSDWIVSRRVTNRGRKVRTFASDCCHCQGRWGIERRL